MSGRFTPVCLVEGARRGGGWPAAVDLAQVGVVFDRALLLLVLLLRFGAAFLRTAAFVRNTKSFDS